MDRAAEIEPVMSSLGRPNVTPLINSVLVAAIFDLI